MSGLLLINFAHCCRHRMAHFNTVKMAGIEIVLLSEDWLVIYRISVPGDAKVWQCHFRISANLLASVVPSSKYSKYIFTISARYGETITSRSTSNYKRGSHWKNVSIRSSIGMLVHCPREKSDSSLNIDLSITNLVNRLTTSKHRIKLLRIGGSQIITTKCRQFLIYNENFLDSRLTISTRNLLSGCHGEPMQLTIDLNGIQTLWIRMWQLGITLSQLTILI